MNGIIELDSDFAKEIGFTSDKFSGYLWRDEGRVLVSFIISEQPGRGNLSALFAAIEAKALRVAVPTPLGKMIDILTRKGFVPHHEDDTATGESANVWEKPR